MVSPPQALTSLGAAPVSLASSAPVSASSTTPCCASTPYARSRNTVVTSGASRLRSGRRHAAWLTSRSQPMRTGRPRTLQTAMRREVMLHVQTQEKVGLVPRTVPSCKDSPTTVDRSVCCSDRVITTLSSSTPTSRADLVSGRADQSRPPPVDRPGPGSRRGRVAVPVRTTTTSSVAVSTAAGRADQTSAGSRRSATTVVCRAAASPTTSSGATVSGFESRTTRSPTTADDARRGTGAARLGVLPDLDVRRPDHPSVAQRRTRSPRRCPCRPGCPPRPSGPRPRRARCRPSHRPRGR